MATTVRISSASCTRSRISASESSKSELILQEAPSPPGRRSLRSNRRAICHH
jgi:hypothetical protein